MASQKVSSSSRSGTAVMLGDAEPEGGQKSQTSSFGLSLVGFGFGGFETWSHHTAQARLETIR